MTRIETSTKRRSEWNGLRPSLTPSPRFRAGAWHRPLFHVYTLAWIQKRVPSSVGRPLDIRWPVVERPSMSIRRTQTRNRATGEADHTHRQVRSTRVGGTVRQVTWLNLGRHFAVAPARLADAVRAPGGVAEWAGRAVTNTLFDGSCPVQLPNRPVGRPALLMRPVAGSVMMRGYFRPQGHVLPITYGRSSSR